MRNPFRKNKTPIVVVIRVEDLQVGDRIVYNTASVEVMDIIQNLDNGTRRIRLGSSHPKFLCRTRQVELYPEMLCFVTR